METLHEKNLTQHPVEMFKDWLAYATQHELNDPEAMALATIGSDGMPDLRMVLLKDVSREGFCFYTNMESKKGEDLAAHPVAALCFHWKSLQRQVRVQGQVEKLPAEMADAYFATRHPLSKLGAWASAQSRPLSSRAELEARVKRLGEKFQGRDIPRPLYWAGYRVVPKKIEFWQAGEGRLHDRFVFTHVKDDMWEVVRLNP